MLISYAFVFVGSVCFALGLLHLLIFYRRRDLKVEFAFSCVAFAIAFSTVFELWTFKTSSLPENIQLFKTTLSVQSLLWIAFSWFVYCYTKSVKLWPPLLITSLYGLALFINVFSPSGILFKEITELGSFTTPSGESFYIVSGPPNPFRIIADISWIILLVYTAAASINFSKRANVRAAVFFAATVFLCLGLGYLHGTLIDFGLARPPYLGSFLFLPLSLVMSYSLAGEVASASILADEVKMAELRWRNLLEYVHLMVLGIDRQKNIFYVNPHFLSITGYRSEDLLGHPFTNIISQEDVREIDDRLISIFNKQASIMPERQITVISKSGDKLQILWSSVLLAQDENRHQAILSIGNDITQQEQAEKSRDEAIRELEYLKNELEKENISLKEIIQTEHHFKEIIGNSDGLSYVINKIQQVAATQSTVLIIGETGTGKELVARAIHKKSDRRDKPFIRINCAAIPEDLVESELFGHEQGAFTDAVKLRRGKFELAEGGTIFLDEISEMPLNAQAKLLHVLQEKELERVGGSQTISLDVRVISATNRDLTHEMSDGRFRADLFYRINIYPITIPPLRQRKEDIPLLVNHFVSMFNKDFGKNINEIPKSSMDILINYDWPGNIRELRNILERAVITCSSMRFHIPDDLAFSLNKNIGNIGDLSEETETLSLVEVERRHILNTLRITNWQIGGPKGAAKILQMNPSTLRSRIKKLKLEKP